MSLMDGESPVVDRIRRHIAEGVYNPRERLVEAELAERYGVTRSALRIALLELASEGLIEREHNRGARVRALSVSEAIEIVEVRRELEALCARRAAEHATEDEREQLLGLVSVMRKAVDDGDYLGYMRANGEFHEAIFAMARHRTAAGMLARLGNLNLNHHFPTVFTSRQPTGSLREHERLAEAIARRDPDRAAAAMHEHLTSLVDMLQRYEAATTAPA
ncbi:MAG: GntR family transcriptional regulator [Solirubrobacterales bacterium]|nr:GntR family transcriptional regulator [Solirubrobacterales bacterium]